MMLMIMKSPTTYIHTHTILYEIIIIIIILNEQQFNNIASFQYSIYTCEEKKFQMLRFILQI